MDVISTWSLLSFQYDIIDIPTAENMEFAVANMKTECDDGQLVPIWDNI